MQRRISDSKHGLIKAIIKHAKKTRFTPKSVDIADFIAQYYRSVSAEDLLERSPEQLAAIALHHLSLGKQRAPYVRIVELVDAQDSPDLAPPDRTILQTICDDSAFLIDTISMVLNDFELGIYLTVHPIINIRRTPKHSLKAIGIEGEPGDADRAESYAHFEFDRIGDNAKRERLQTRLEEALADVHACTRDWRKMRAKAKKIAATMRTTKTVVPRKDREETADLLDWMANNHFTFLGYREYKVKGKTSDPKLVPVKGSGLGILRKSNARKTQTANPNIQAAITKQIHSRVPLVITKANSRSSVHRSVQMDYIGIKKYNDDGVARTEQRFLGLFTSAAYNRSPRDIPYLRRKVEKVMSSFALPEQSHANKALLNVLETFPRDELFQSSVEDLKRISEGVLGLQERKRVRMFIRRDPYRRFIACTIYVPKEEYSTAVRERIEKVLLRGFSGSEIDSKVLISESALARLQCIVTTPPMKKRRIELAKLEKEIAATAQSWRGALRNELYDRLGHDTGANLFDRYGASFSAAYEEDFTPYEATFDIERIDQIDQHKCDILMALYRPPSFSDDQLRFKVFQADKPIPISDVLPMLENMGMRVISERPYRCETADQHEVFVQEFEMVSADKQVVDLIKVNQRFQDTFESAWRGHSESDGFNHLVISAGLSWRQVRVVRAYSRYLQQTGLPFSQSYMEEVFQSNPDFAANWSQAFEIKFDPEADDSGRIKKLHKAYRALKRFIDKVASADEDRIFRSYLAALDATLRTNYYQMDENGKDKPYVSFKLNPSLIPGVPKPLPAVEVFVFSARMEGIHLRGGSVARGGIRWSDRREDFRTEVLGLMKAQKVKNTVIVPTGAKGGFVCKRLPDGERDAIQAEVINCYKTLIFGLLDITDNLKDNKVIPPQKVVRHDEDDPYLVVAADKGTATFSDIANGVAADYGFWLGDAFASGGSVGYDHKGMGITAKGAWVAVKRHFKELGIDTQEQVFTVAGIGDMGGDVFGNGLLRSKTIKMLAAFNHMHIFIDPDPHPGKSFKERQRLFDLPRSSWEDYKESLISEGGGIYSRKLKTIPLSTVARKILDLPEGGKDPSPNEVIKAILCMQVDLLWNGGIGTYVKAAVETHREAGDRSNDAVRVNGSELRCRVVGEGGNLGLTQLGRVEYALSDGKINTDFIDNAGGVNCSDREVNIKILLNLVMSQSTLSTAQRNKLLASMTDEVEELVLQDNYFQTQALSTLESDAADRASEQLGFIRTLEQNGELDRELEFLPSDAEVLERQQNGKGLSRPELSILLSYSKIHLISQLVESSKMDNEFTRDDLNNYFPKPLQKKYAKLLGKHRLAREIMATQTGNSLVNRMGPTYVARTQEETGASAGEIARAYTIARETLDLRPLWRSIEALDNKVQAKAQYRMLTDTARLMRRTSIWLLQRPQFANDTRFAIDTFQPAIANLSSNLSSLLRDVSLQQFKDSRDIYQAMGVSRSLSQKLAGLRYLYCGYDIAQVAARMKVDDQFVARVYFRLARGLRMTWLTEQIENLGVRGRWQALARGTMRENIYEIQRAATAQAIESNPKNKDDRAVADSWLKQQEMLIDRAHRVIADMRSIGSMDFSTLSVAVQEMRKLVQS